MATYSNVSPCAAAAQYLALTRIGYKCRHRHREYHAGEQHMLAAMGRYGREFEAALQVVQTPTPIPSTLNPKLHPHLMQLQPDAFVNSDDMRA